MTEKNSKHTIFMYYDFFKFYIKDFKLLRSAKVAEIPTFTDEKQYCFQGLEHERIKATAMIDKSRITTLLTELNNFIGSNTREVIIDDVSYGYFMLTNYEICISQDDYVYEVSLTFYKS